MPIIEPMLKFSDLPSDIQKLFDEVSVAFMQQGLAAIFWQDLKGSIDKIELILEFIASLSEKELGYHGVYDGWEYFLIFYLEKRCFHACYKALSDQQLYLKQFDGLYGVESKAKQSEDKLIKLEKSFFYDNYTWHCNRTIGSIYIRLFPYYLLKDSNRSQPYKLLDLLNELNRAVENEVWINPNPFLTCRATEKLYELEKAYGLNLPSFEELLNLSKDSYAEHYYPNFETGNIESRAKFYWRAYGDRVEFISELVEAQNDNLCSLFLHAKFNKFKKAFDHIDGAIYSYNEADYHIRFNESLENRMTPSFRKKIFRIDGWFSYEQGLMIIEGFFNSSIVNEYLGISRSFN
ncbi:MAG: hypothetical protein K0S29_911 [Gammaproteobacteria bacterium]|jgi:hypothetical protein|nr:hypothetical protein [Gammaproteobacteria bacterium]